MAPYTLIGKAEELTGTEEALDHEDKVWAVATETGKGKEHMVLGRKWLC